MTRERAEELLRTDDLISVGMQSDEARTRLLPERIVTYGDKIDGESLDVTFLPGDNWIIRLDELKSRAPEAIRIVAGPGLMAVDYLRLVAVCRLYLDVSHIEADWRSVGLKIAQLALRFGADDLGTVVGRQNEPGIADTPPVPEEEIRRLIRDAGFVPKKRLARYGALAIS